MKSGGEEKNVGGVLMGRELDGSEICDGLKNDVGSVRKERDRDLRECRKRGRGVECLRDLE